MSFGSWAVDGPSFDGMDRIDVLQSPSPPAATSPVGGWAVDGAPRVISAAPATTAQQELARQGLVADRCDAASSVHSAVVHRSSL